MNHHFATTRSLSGKAPNTFRVAVAGAPVTSWDGYDTHYTERCGVESEYGIRLEAIVATHCVTRFLCCSRYMSTPELNPDGYRVSSVCTHVNKMVGKLLLVHGLIDENVHFRHTARLINALISHRKPYDLLLFPDERHSPRKLQDRVYMEQRIAEYFVENLMPGATDSPIKSVL